LLLVEDLLSLDLERVRVNRTRDLHPWTNHNYWLVRIGVCPYCLSGSEPVDESEILELIP